MNEHVEPTMAAILNTAIANPTHAGDSITVAPGTLTLADIQHQILEIGVNATPDQVSDAMVRVNWLKRAVKDVSDKLEAAMLEWCQEHGDLTIGDIRYYAGTKNTTKCVNVPGAVEAVLNAVGGDFSAFCEHLSSQPVKYGAARKLLPPGEYEKLFVTTEDAELVEGKPKKTLQSTNTRYLK